MEESSFTSNAYLSDYGEELAADWDRLIGWDARAKAEGSFLPDLLKRLSVRSVLDVASGSGFHSALLAKEGFEVEASDGVSFMVEAARKNFHEQALEVKTHVADWRRVSEIIRRQFDAVICLGNSYSHLFSEADRRNALGQFAALLKPGGFLIIDHRNYDAIMDNEDGGPTNSYCCCSDRSSVKLSVAARDLVLIKCSLDGKEVSNIRTYPLRRAQLFGLLEEASFEIVDSFGDFRSNATGRDIEFYLHAAQKKV